MSAIRITADLPGAGGLLKATPEDFRVDELPAYEPSGAGPHLYVRVEKRGLTTRDVVTAVARALGTSERDAGWAGMKDRQAVTTQWLSFLHPRDVEPGALAGDGWSALAVSRHANKLKPGHSRGNRFALRVRGGDLGRARACAAALEERGLPNFFGAQRFGRDGRNAALGKAILLGGADPEARRAARDRFMRRLAISAFQSLLFNRWLAERIADGLFAAALPGDVLKKLDTGGLFTCEDAAADTARVGRFEISPAGPMFGHAMRAAAGEAALREARLLEAEGIALADFARGGGEAEGTRRPGRLSVRIALDPAPDGFTATFELPRGAYATVVMGELLKEEHPGLPEED